MENAADRVRVRLIIEGRVQGVFFRASALEQATRLGVKGGVRNCQDGTVEIVAEGFRKDIQELIEWCHHGPPGAHVSHVRIQWQEYQDEFRDFRIRR